MKTIKIKFCDFWSHWNQEDNFIINVLKKKYNVIISEEPDYIFFSNFNEDFQHMDYNDCVKIFYTQENIVPDFNYADYGIGFDEIQYADRYMQYPIYLIKERYGKYWSLMKDKHILEMPEKYCERGFCSYVVSNGNADEIRKYAFEKLCNYKKVDSGGKYMNNIDQPEGVEDKLEFAKKHKFSLCFENTSHPGYTTEKIVEAFAAKTIPIYWGDPSVTKIFNSKAFVNVADYDSLDDMVVAVQEIDENQELYLKMLQTPALKVENDYWERKQEEFEKFLYNIFDSEKEKAYRRNLKFWGKEYHKRYYKMRNVFIRRKYSLKTKSVNLIKKIIRKLQKTILGGVRCYH